MSTNMTWAHHAGVQLAKMSPFRSYVVTTASTLSSIVAVGLHLGGGVSSYVNVSLLAAGGTPMVLMVTVLRFLTLWLLVRQHQCRGALSCCLAILHGFCFAKLLVLHGLFGPSPHFLCNDQLHMHSMHYSTFALLSQPCLRVHRS